MVTGCRTVRLRRALLSRAFAGAVVVLVLAGLLWSLHAVTSRHQQRIAAEALSIARVVVSAVVDPNLDHQVVTTGRLSPAAAADLRGDDAGLRRAGRLTGLAIWRLDGTLLFRDSPPGSGPMRVTATELARARTGAPWTTAAGPGQLRALMPTSAGAAPGQPPTALVEVGVPPAAAAETLDGQALRQQLSVIATVLLLLGGLLWLRRGLLRRERHARTDPLTGLPNRRALHEDARRLLAATTSHRPAALLLLDLNEFKAVNNTLGHPAGDALLRQVATALRSLARPGDLIVRLGGDEFAILLPDLPDDCAAQLRAEQLLASLRKTPITVDGLSLSVDASIGVALAPTHGRRIDELLQRADVAMYQAKAGHRGTSLYDPDTDRHTTDQLKLVAELRRALDHGEFVLHYQPKIALPAQKVYAVEALVRWQHPTRGLLPPAEFLPVMESTGLMQQLSEWVLREAVCQAASWRRAGMPLKVAVNLSTRSLLNPALPDKVLATLTAAGLPPACLELEITETAIMSNPERAAHILTELRAQGIEVSIDDFGAGYTSLAFLRLLPISALKIDRSLVTHILDCPQAEAVVAAVIDLGHRLGLRVIAEGVETGELLRRLVDLGCDRAQGYLISRPQPPAVLEDWLTARQPTSGTTALPTPRTPGRRRAAANQ